MARAGWCRVVSARSARAVHTSNAVRDRLRGASTGPVKHAVSIQSQVIHNCQPFTRHCRSLFAALPRQVRRVLDCSGMWW